MTKKSKIILKSISAGIVFMVVIFAMLIAGVRIFGLKVYTVLSPSMEPEYKTGTMIYVKSVDAHELEVGDVITYSISKETTVTHRIVDINKVDDVLYFITKGDANKSADSGRVHMDDVLGKSIFKIHYLGYVASFITTPPGSYLGIFVGVTLAVCVFIIDYITCQETDVNKKGEKNNGKTENGTVVH